MNTDVPKRLGRPPGTKRKWTPVVEDLLASHYGRIPPAHIANILTAETGVKFTGNAVSQYAKREMGLSPTDAQGDLSISDAAKELGITVYRLHWFIKKYNLEVTGSGYCRFLTPESWRAVQAFYTQPPEPTITIKAAARRLNYSVDWVHKAVKAQRLRAWKYGGHWCVSAADVERQAWDLIRSKR